MIRTKAGMSTLTTPPLHFTKSLSSYDTEKKKNIQFVQIWKLEIKQSFFKAGLIVENLKQSLSTTIMKSLETNNSYSKVK